jgi:disulfide oxidoreductase YuzD
MNNQLSDDSYKNNYIDILNQSNKKKDQDIEMKQELDDWVKEQYISNSYPDDYTLKTRFTTFFKRFFKCYK